MSPGPYTNHLYSIQNPHSIQNPTPLAVEQATAQMESIALSDTEDQVNTYNNKIAHKTNIILYFQAHPTGTGAVVSLELERQPFEYTTENVIKALKNYEKSSPTKISGVSPNSFPY